MDSNNQLEIAEGAGFGSQIIPSTSTATNENEQTSAGGPSVAESIPEEMLCQIFKRITKKSLLDCRLVSSMWKKAITNNPKLIKSLTFNITNAQAFLNSELSTKAKSIRFTKPLLQNSEKCLEEFFKKIGSTVEQVYFDFGKFTGSSKKISESKKRQKLMFSLLLQYCTKMTELIIGSKENTNCNFIRACGKGKEDPKYAAVLSTIQNLSIHTKKTNFTQVRKLLQNLPNLRCFHLYIDYDDDDDDSEDSDEQDEDDCEVVHEDEVSDMDEWVDADVFGLFETPELQETQIILEHLQKYDGNLKEISIDSNGFSFVADGVDDENNDITKFYLILGKLYPNTNFKCAANLRDLCTFKEITENTADDADLQVNETTCRAIKEGIIEFTDKEIDTNRIAFCKNLHLLKIIINLKQEVFHVFDVEYETIDQITSTHLAFIYQLHKLTYLKIKDLGLDFEDEEEEQDRLLSAQAFSYGIPTVTTLDFDGEGLGLKSMRFHTCFPNLTKLYIRNYTSNLSVSFIFNLTNLDQLKSLTFEKIHKLVDRHLTKTYDFMDKDNKEITNLPAIAGFKSLKRLHIIECYRLTDKCLVNGLALCMNLDRITLCYASRQGKFTTAGLLG